MRLALLIALLAACTQPRSKQCKEICSREADCIAETKSDIPFDEKECVAACSALEQDPQNRAKVEEHSTCVAKHSCEDLLTKCN